MLIKMTAIIFEYQGKKLRFEIPMEKQIDFNYGFEPVREEGREEALKNEIEAAGGCILAYIEKSMKALLQSKKEEKDEIIIKYFIFSSEERETEKYEISGRLSFLKMETNIWRAIEFAGTTFLLSISEVKRRYKSQYQNYQKRENKIYQFR